MDISRKQIYLNTLLQKNCPAMALNFSLTGRKLTYDYLWFSILQNIYHRKSAWKEYSLREGNQGLATELADSRDEERHPASSHTGDTTTELNACRSGEQGTGPICSCWAWLLRFFGRQTHQQLWNLEMITCIQRAKTDQCSLNNGFLPTCPQYICNCHLSENPSACGFVIISAKTWLTML